MSLSHFRGQDARPDFRPKMAALSLSASRRLSVCLTCSNGRILSFTAAAAFRNYNCGIRECWGNRTAIIKLSSSSLSENDQDVEIKDKYLTQFQLHT